MKISNIEIGNNTIKEFIADGKPFMVNRMRAEMGAIYKIENEIKLTDNDYNALNLNTGVYPERDMVQINNFCKETVDSLKITDAFGYWMGNLPNQNYFIKKYSPEAKLFHHRTLEPFYTDTPWTLSLKGLKVLIIHPYQKTIDYQINNLNNIWKEKSIFPDCEIKTLKAVQSIGNNNPHDNWTDSLEFMKEQIKMIDFDIALLGCGGYGMPLCGFIKTIGKSAVYIGGGLQLFFGIKGKRWDNHEVSKYFNQHWLRPFPEDVPLNHESIEGGCYW